jgi:hypothetical protein
MTGYSASSSSIHILISFPHPIRLKYLGLGLEQDLGPGHKRFIVIPQTNHTLLHMTSTNFLAASSLSSY